MSQNIGILKYCNYHVGPAGRGGSLSGRIIDTGARSRLGGYHGQVQLVTHLKKDFRYWKKKGSIFFERKLLDYLKTIFPIISSPACRIGCELMITLSLHGWSIPVLWELMISLSPHGWSMPVLCELMITLSPHGWLIRVLCELMITLSPHGWSIPVLCELMITLSPHSWSACPSPVFRLSVSCIPPVFRLSVSCLPPVSLLSPISSLPPVRLLSPVSWL